MSPWPPPPRPSCIGFCGAMSAADHLFWPLRPSALVMTAARWSCRQPSTAGCQVHFEGTTVVKAYLEVLALHDNCICVLQRRYHETSMPLDVASGACISFTCEQASNARHMRRGCVRSLESCHPAPFLPEPLATLASTIPAAFRVMSASGTVRPCGHIGEWLRTAVGKASLHRHTKYKGAGLVHRGCSAATSSAQDLGTPGRGGRARLGRL